MSEIMGKNYFSAYICINHNGKIKKVQWRKNLNASDFIYLLKNIYKIDGKIIGLKDQQGTIYEINYLINHKDKINKEPYTLLIKKNETDQFISINYQNIFQIASLIEYENKILAGSSSNILRLLFVFKEFLPQNSLFLGQIDEALRDYPKIQCYFMRIHILENSKYSNQFRLTPPLLACFSSFQKMMELSLKNDEGLENIERILDRLNSESSQSLFDINLSDNASSYYILDENECFKDSKVNSSNNSFILDSENESIYELKEKINEDDSENEIYNISSREHYNTNNNHKEHKDDIENKIIYSNNLFKKNTADNKNKKSYFLPLYNQINIPPKNLENTDRSTSKDKSPSKYTDFYSFLHTNVNSFEPEEYGMAMCLYKEKDKELFDLLNDCRELNDNDLNTILIKSLSKRRFSRWLIDNCTREIIEKIEFQKLNSKTKIYTAFQCFKYDNDLEDLKVLIEKAFKQTDKEIAIRKPTDSIVEYEIHEYDGIKSGPNSEFDELAVIKEKSAKDEESPGIIPELFSGLGLMINKNKDVDEKKGKYASMVSHRNNNMGNNVKKEGFNLTLIGNKENHDRNSHKKVLQIDCEEHPLAREVIEKFFQTDETEKYMEGFKRFLAKSKFYGSEVENLRNLFEQRDPSLFLLIDRFLQNEREEKNIDNMLLELKNLSLGTDNSANISSSPRSIKKVRIFNLFKSVIDQFFEDHDITSMQVKLFLYLFIQVEMSILAAFEVYQLTKDKRDFLDSLNLIYKIHYIKLEQELDEIEEYDDVTETQLKIVYAFQTDFDSSERKTLEQLVKSKDDTLFKLHDNYRKDKDKVQFISKVKELCHSISTKIKENEIKKRVSVELKEEQKGKRKQLVEICKAHRFLKEVNDINMLLEMIENDHPLTESVFSVYEFTLDKQDLTENLTILHKFKYKELLLCLIREITEEKHWTEIDCKIINDAIDENNKLILGAYNLYCETKSDDDREELIDTLIKFLKIQKSK